ncbi:MAG: DUF1304 domain-containing protein [Pseudobacteriovorax sp.]|nr:DUF1304 domain-containing protein [Pseudobacteriovorax sp.]
MTIINTILVILVALLHFYFLYLEMFLWTKPRTRKIFGLTESFANESVKLAANQGMYNGFLASGLVYGLLIGDHPAGQPIIVMNLVFVCVAAVYGAYSVSRKILFVQGAPALLALLTMWLA